MASNKWVYRLSDGLFLYGGAYEPSYSAATQGVVIFPDADPAPNPRTERYLSLPPWKRAATTQEVAAYDASQLDAMAITQADERVIDAVVWAILDTFTQTTPATKAKFQTARTKIIAAYKSQPWK